MSTLRLNNGVEIELLEKNGLFLGLGKVRSGGTLLRAGDKPAFVDLRSPNGVSFCDFKVKSRKVSATGLDLEFSMSRCDQGPMDWMLHTIRPRVNTRDWTRNPSPALDASLSLKIRPVSRLIQGLAFEGFSTQYRMRCPSAPVYKILDRSTWEPGGRAVGNEFWMRTPFSQPVFAPKAAKDVYSTEWYLAEGGNPSIFQFLPFQTELQGFTFTASSHGLLVTWSPQTAHIRSLFEKPRGTDRLFHWHELCDDLAADFTAPAMEVLWAKASLDRVGRANAYEAVRDFTYERLHKNIGMRRERVSTYGLIEEWEDPDVSRYARLGVPRLLKAGMKKIGLANHFMNHMNVFGISNMCCSLDYKFPPELEKPMQRLCRAARAGKAKVEMWGNTSVSTLVYLFSRRSGGPKRIKFLPEKDSVVEVLRKSKDPYVRNPSGAMEADHYTPSFACLNLRDPDIRAYWLKRWKQAAQKTGLQGIFLDSSFNLSSDKFHFRAKGDKPGLAGATADQLGFLGQRRPSKEDPGQVLSQYRAHLDLMAKMQKLGYDYDNEDIGVFGIHRHGPGLEARLDCMHLWSDCLTAFDAPAIQKAGHDPEDIFFRGLAYRQMWILYWDIRADALSFCYVRPRGSYDVPKPHHLALLKAFNLTEPFMYNRGILAGEKGVIYTKGRVRVLWAFADMKLPLGKPAKATDLVTGKSGTADSLSAAKQHVYLIQS